jgi:hypothetical protein
MKRWIFCWGTKISKDYLTRWGFSTPYGGIYLHKFIGPDPERDLHDHPWQFAAVIISGGYVEISEGDGPGKYHSAWYGPGSLLLRADRWRHRIWIPEKHVCWSLVVIGKRRRHWGFYDQRGYFTPYGVARS